MRVTLCENMRAVPYVPFYLALAGGYWRGEGLEVRHVLSPSTARTATALLDGSVDVSWGGPMRVMMHHDADPACPLVCFAQVVARDPFLLVGRTRKSAFRWHDLVGLRVAPAGDVPTPWMTFQDDLQRAGLDPASIAGRRVRPMVRNLDAYGRGTVDVVQVFEPYADALVSEGVLQRRVLVGGRVPANRLVEHHEEEAVERLGEEQLEPPLALAQRRLHPAARDRSAEQPGRGLQRVDLRRRPLALGVALCQPDMTPQLLLDKDRHRRDRADVEG